MSLILLANVSNEIRSDDVLRKKTNKKKKKQEIKLDQELVRETRTEK